MDMRQRNRSRDPYQCSLGYVSWGQEGQDVDAQLGCSACIEK